MPIPISFAPILSRKEWGAEPARGLIPLHTKHPLPKVLAVLKTKIGDCTYREDCLTKIKQIQKLHMDSGLPDIAYNFIIGNDEYMGQVYEGRGWNQKSQKSIDHPDLYGDVIVVGFIGDWADDSYPHHLQIVLHNLCRDGFNRGFMLKHYTADCTREE